jgi:hypothetical protein
LGGHDRFFQALRWYSNGDGTGQYRVVETSQANAQGVASMFLEFNTAQYIFRAIDIQNNIIDASFNTPTRLFDQDVVYRVTQFTDFFDTTTLLGTLQNTQIQYFNTTSQFYQYQYANKPSALDEICLEYDVVNGAFTNSSKICSSSTSATLILQFNTTNQQGFYSVVAYGIGSSLGGDIIFNLQTRQDTFIDFATLTDQYALVGLFVMFIFAITCAGISLVAPIVGIILSALALGLFGILGLKIISIEGIVIISIIIISVIVGLVFKK